MLGVERYRVVVQLRPKADQKYEDPRFIRDTHACWASFQDRFRPTAESIEHDPGVAHNVYPWVHEIIAMFGNKEEALRVRQWMNQEPATFLDNRAWTIAAPASAQCLSHAKWVRAEGASSHVKEVVSPTPLRCAKCGWHDYETIPDPLLIDERHVGGKRDITFGSSGFLIVTEPVLQALHDLASDEFTLGDVQVRGKKPAAAAPLHWVRPRHHTGAYPSQKLVGEPCADCGMPEKYSNGGVEPTLAGGEVVQSFGDASANMARIGEFPQHADRSWPPTRLVRYDVALSGGLFAALYNMGFKGLAWPTWGPLISLRPSDATWEPERKFDRTLPKQDKFMKHNEHGDFDVGEVHPQHR